MEIINRTPFVPLLFESQDVDGDDFHAFVLKGTFEILNGRRLKPSQNQQPLVMADQYRSDDLFGSSVRCESDIVPLKPNGELTLDAIAVAPGGVPTESWIATARIGKIEKAIRVTGPRYWEFNPLRGWHLTRPEPATCVPIIYELAYGGKRIENNDIETYPLNPAGVGFYNRKSLRVTQRYAAPQLESPDNAIVFIDQRYTPEGFGPIAKHWVPRRELCGTADEAWKSTRWPKLPEDFDTEYYNGAPPDQVYDGFFKGDEPIVLTGMAKEGDLKFALPCYKIDLYVADIDDYRIQVAMNLDTVHLDVVNRLAHLVWRGTFLKMEPLETAEVRMSGPGVIHHG